MNLREIQSEVRDWNRHNFPNKKPHQALLGMAEEVGELAHAHLKMEQGIRGTPEEHQAAKKDALADLLVFTMDYCNQHDIDLETTLLDVWLEVKKRDWIKFPKDGLTC